MSVIHPFRALRPTPQAAAQVAAVPYDVVNRAEAQVLASNQPLSFLHISRSEIDLPEEKDAYSKAIYKKASENFEKLIQECPLIEDQVPSLYLYRLRMGTHEQVGIVGCFSIDEYDSNLIKKHERTRPEKEDDRTRHMLSLSAQTGPVFLTYSQNADLDAEVKKTMKHSPLYDFTASDGVGHAVWEISNPEAFVELFKTKIAALYIADGHHRAAAASRVRAELSKANPHHQGNEEYNFVLGVAFPESELQILPYHRVVKDLNGFTSDQLLEKIKAHFHVEMGDRSLPRRGLLGMYLDGRWYRLDFKSDKNRYPLDVTLLQEEILGSLLGIQDPRADKRIDFVGGIRGTEELEKLVNNKEAAIAFSLHPTQLRDVMEVADQGGIMPPKSTWFEPKLRDGLFCHRLK